MTRRGHARRFIKQALCLVWKERRCHACLQPFLPEGKAGETIAGALFCPDCEKLLPRRQAGFCPACGELAAWPELPPALCGACLKERPPWQSVFFYSEYSGLLRSLLLGLKFGGKLVNAHALGVLLARHPELSAMLDRVDIVVPVPLHPGRASGRGYNQTLEIARRFLASAGRPDLLSVNSLVRTSDTPPQRGLNRRERLDNTRSAFRSAPGIEGLRVLLLDDVMTTGATLRAATLALQKGGVTAVHVAVVGRTGHHWRLA